MPFTTIRDLLKQGPLQVPTYQRAYSWDSPREGLKASQVATFLEDLEAHAASRAESPYYLGHFLFESKAGGFQVIDGQQRLTTTTILLSVLFQALRERRDLTEAERDLYAETIKPGPATYRFSTVAYDDGFFRDYAIDQIRLDRSGLETMSARRIADAFDYFRTRFSGAPESEVLRLLQVLLDATCTTHSIGQEAEIRSFLSGPEPRWDADAIRRRQEKITAFVMSAF